ncbi:tetratricopeptide repeat protein [Tautonia plasticadhaerens]|uniref:tetratricopeptide repeat protein n=1 Tax=Tautonia plasticadhaerens TaxID=2527974 RepID=UPI00119D3B13|nr:tetratricopeptide repeat protein [Tautonia plasticadhaerens]
MGRSRSKQRLNVKAVIGTAIVVLVLVGGGLLAAGVFQDRVRDQVLTQSRDLIEGDNPGMALRHLERFLSKNPDDVEVLDRYATLLSEAVLRRGDFGRIDPAIASNERLLRLDPEGAVAEDPQQNRRRLIELYILRTELTTSDFSRFSFREADQRVALESRYQAAANVARDLIARGADDAEAHRLLAIAQEGVAGKDDARLRATAVESYEKALARDPADRVAAERLARAYRDRLGRPEKADQVLEELARAAPDSADSWLAVYRHYAHSKAPGKATEALNKAVELAPDDTAVVMAAATDALDRGDVPAARGLLDRLPDRTRALPEVELMRATIDFQERQTDEAIARLREGLKNVGGANERLVLYLANALIESGNLAEAAPLVSRYKGLAGSESTYLYLLGLYQQKAGEPAKAIDSFDGAERGINEALKPRMLVARGRCKLILGRGSDAIQDFRAAVAADPRSAQARLALVDALARGGVDRALVELREGIASAPESPELRRALLQILLAIQAARPANQRSWLDFDSALRDIREQPALADDPALTALQAQREMLDGRTDDAVALLETAVEAHPDASILWSTWVDTLVRAGRRADALSVLERASRPEAAGDSATYRVLRSQLLTQLGRGGEAIDLLVAGASTLPTDQRAPILQALGRMQSARGKLSEARNSYLAWQRLQPGSAAPTLALLELAIDTGNTEEAEAALRDLRGSSEDPGLPYRLGYAEYLLRIPGGDRGERAKKALEQLEPILAEGSQTAKLPAALLLRGLAYREQARLEDEGPTADALLGKALIDLRQARDLGERKATAPMIDVLVQLDDFAAIDDLPRLTSGGLDHEIDKLATEACIRQGKLERAADYLERTTQAAPNTPQFSAWRVTVLDRLGQTPQVEQALLAQARNRKDASAWISLIRYQAARGRREQAEEAIAEMKRTVKVDPPELLEAQVREAIGDRQAAGLAYEAALGKRPESPDVLLAAARFDQTAGRFDRALEHAEKALAADPSSRPAARMKALLLAERAKDAPSWQLAWDALGPEPPEADDQAPQDRLARAILLARHPEASRREEAVGRLEALVGDQPSGDVLAAAARETLAKLLLQQDQPERAAEVAAVTALSATNPAAVALYAQALLAAEQVDEAARQLDRLENLAPNSPALTELELRLVEARAEAGSKAEGLEAAYFEAVEQADGDPTARAVATFRRLVQLGEPAVEVADRVGRDLAGRFPEQAWLPSQWLASRDAYPDALELAEAAIASEDPSASFQGARAVLTVVERSGASPDSMGRAEELIERAAAAGPPANRAMLGMFRHFQGRIDPARFQDEIRIYRELLGSEPDNVIYLNNLAWALGECSDQPEEALDLIDRAFQSLGTRLPELLDTRGVILDRLGRHDEAVTTIEEALEAQPNKAIYHFHLARALDAVGRTEDARASLSRALELGLTADDVEPTEVEDFDRLKALEST